MTTLMGAVAAMKQCPNQDELLVTFASCLSEIMAADGAAQGSVDLESLMRNCVSALTNHSGSSSVCRSVLRLMRTACAAQGSGTGSNSPLGVLLECGGIDAIATQIRLHPSDDTELLSHALEIYGAACVDADKTRAMEVVQRSGRQLVRCLEENAAIADDSERSLATLIPALLVLEACAQSGEGRLITSKLGAVKSVLAILDAAAAQPDVVDAAARALTAIVTATDVLRVVERLQLRVDDLKASQGAEEVLKTVTDDVKKLGLLMMCGDFSAVIQEGGGVQSLVDIISFVDALSDESGARDELLRSCFTAFGRATTGEVELANAVGVIPALVRCMREDPSTDTLLAMGALAACNSTLLESLVQHGAIEALVPILGDLSGVAADGTDQAAGINACFKGLAAFSLSADGVARVVSCGGLAFVVDNLREELLAADASGCGGAICAAVALLSNVAENGAEAADTNVRAELLAAGVLDLCSSSLGQLQTLSLSGDGPTAIADVSAMTALQGLIVSLCADEKKDGATISNAVVESGIVQQVNILMQTPAFASNIECALATNGLFASLCTSGFGPSLKDIDADGLLLRTMNANSTNDVVARACAQTIVAITGDESGGASTFTKVDVPISQFFHPLLRHASMKFASRAV